MRRAAGVFWAFVLIPGSAGTAAAFEVDGFRSGMSSDEAIKIARGLGGKIIHHDGGKLAISGWSILTASNEHENPIKWQISFCDAKAVKGVNLVRITKEYRLGRESMPGFGARSTTADLSFVNESMLSEAVARLNRRYGEGEVRIREMQNPSFGLNLFWRGENDYVNIFTFSLGKGSYKNSVDVTESYRDHEGLRACGQVPNSR